MWPYTQKPEATFDNIKKDIACFANIGTFECVNHDNWMDASWQERQQQKNARFLYERNGIFVRYNNIVSAYSDFLASSYMADLHYSANQIISLIPKCDNYISTNVTDDEIADNTFFDTVYRLVSMPTQDKKGDLISATRLVFVRGSAGTGKTIAVKELVREQAKHYMEGQQRYIYIYINAQSRALSRIDEVMAYDVQRYGFSFFHTAVSALARNSLLVPIIDGFDELIGSGGFADAFKSLSSFLSTLEQNGAVIATGRSTFYDTNVLAYAAGLYSHNESLNYEFSTINILPWNETEIYRYFTNSFAEYDNRQLIINSLKHLIDNISDYNKIILSKPFYCAQLVELIKLKISNLPSANIKNYSELAIDLEHTDLIEYLISYFLDREKEKFKNRTGHPILDIDGHRFFLQQLSLELWWQEKRVIDRETLETVTEFTIEATNISPEDQPIFSGKIDSYAFLQSHGDQKQNELKFESDVYYDYFLMGSMIDILDKDIELYLRQFLSRSLLSETILDYFHSFANKLPPEKIIFYINKICNSVSKSPTGSLARRNGGALSLAMLEDRSDIDNICLHDIEGYGVSISNFITHNTSIRDCYFKDIKMYGTSLFDCSILKSSFSNIFITENTIFNGTTISADTIINKLIIDTREYFSFNDIQEILSEHGLVRENKIIIVRQMNGTQKNIFKLLSSFFEKSRRKLYFDLNPQNEPALAPIFRNSNWDKLCRMLLQNGILEKKQRDRAGTSQYLYRLIEQLDDISSCIQDATKCKNNNMKNFYDAFWQL
jgi:hypothetical protein